MRRWTSPLRLGLALGLGNSRFRLLLSPDTQPSERTAKREQGETSHPSERRPVAFDGHVPGDAAIYGTEYGH